MTAISQDTSVSSTDVADDISVDPSLLSSSPSFTDYQLAVINSFPWMAEFIKLCRRDMINSNPRSLEKLMNFYHKNVSLSVKECYSRPIRATKLKRSMSEVLIFFHMSYSELKPPLEHSSYLAKMSDLMALYLDMEIKASRTGSESLNKIASKLTSCLLVFFGRSHDHILDTILKSKMISRNSWELCDLIFRRVLRDSTGSSAYVMTYIRYLLAFKLWKGIISCPEEKKKIQLVAERRLSLPPGFREKLSCGSVLRDILPRIPKAKKDITKFLLEAKFVVRDKIKMFLKAVADPKLQCALDRQNFASVNNFSIPDEKEDNDHNLLMNDWSNMSLESDIGDSLLLNKIIYGSDNKKIHKLKNGLRSVGKNELKKKRKKIEIPVEDIGEDDKESGLEIVEDNSVSVIKPEVEEIIKKDQINQVDGDTMAVATEAELPSSPAELTDIPTIKLEPQSAQPKESVVYPWGILSMQPYYNQNGYDYTFDSKSEEFVVEKTPETVPTAVMDLLSKHEIDSSKIQASENYSNVKDHCSAQRLGVIIPTEQVLLDTKSIDALRAQGILYEKCFPSRKISIPIEEHDVETQSEEIHLEEINEEISLEEELDVENISQRSLGLHDKEERPIEECNKGRPSEVNNVERSSQHNRENSTENNNTPSEKGGILHDFTLINDNQIYKFHVNINSNMTKLNRRSWISLIFPLFTEQEIKTPRCFCHRCKQNYDILIKIWRNTLDLISQLHDKTDENGIFADEFEKNILKGMKDSLEESNSLKLLVWENEVEELHKKIEEIKEENEHSNLPLKKRKAFSYSSYAQDETSEMSYPNTPMISIAEVELAKENYRLNAMNINHTPMCSAPRLNYIPDYNTPHSSYTNPPNVLVSPNILANIPPDQNPVPGAFTTTFLPEHEDCKPRITTDQNPVPGAFTTTFIPDHEEQCKPRVKTPAELKVFTPKLLHQSDVVESLILFSQKGVESHENQEPSITTTIEEVEDIEVEVEIEKEKRKTRQKTKSSRKRKRIT